MLSSTTNTPAWCMGWFAGVHGTSNSPALADAAGLCWVAVSWLRPEELDTTIDGDRELGDLMLARSPGTDSRPCSHQRPDAALLTVRPRRRYPGKRGPTSANGFANETRGDSGRQDETPIPAGRRSRRSARRAEMSETSKTVVVVLISQRRPAHGRRAPRRAAYQCTGPGPLAGHFASVAGSLSRRSRPPRTAGRQGKAVASFRFAS
jgi:hypothetical protein